MIPPVSGPLRQPRDGSPLDEIEAYADDPLNGRVRLVSVPRADALAPPGSQR